MYIVNPVLRVRRIEVQFTEEISYSGEQFAFDLYLGAWMGSTEYRAGASKLIFHYTSEMSIELTGYDNGVINSVPLRGLIIDTELKSKSNKLLSAFEIKILNFDVGTVERVVKVMSNDNKPLAEVTFKLQLDGQLVSSFEDNLPRFDARGTIAAQGQVGLSNSYQLCAAEYAEIDETITWGDYVAINRGKVGITNHGDLYGGMASKYVPSGATLEYLPAQSKVLSVLVGSISINNGVLLTQEKKSFRKTYLDEIHAPPKLKIQLKLTIESCFGPRSQIFICDGVTKTVLYSIKSPVIEASLKVNGDPISRRFRTLELLVEGVEHGTVVDIILMTSIDESNSVSLLDLFKKTKDSSKGPKAAPKASGASAAASTVANDLYISDNRQQVYGSAEVRSLIAEVMTSKDEAKKKFPELRTSESAPFFRRSAPLNPIPLRPVSRPSSAARPHSAQSRSPSPPFSHSLSQKLVLSDASNALATASDSAGVLRCSPFVAAKPETTWDDRQLFAFKLFHKHCAGFILSTYGEACATEYKKRVTATACRECREKVERYEEAEDSAEQGVEGSGKIEFPVFCLRASCAHQFMYTYRSQRYIETLTYGIVGDMAGWILPKKPKHFHWDRWVERDKGYERKKNRLEFEHKASVYNQNWVEKWVCPQCGGFMPYNEDDELRREFARLRLESVMFGKLENWSEEAEDEGGINFTTMKASDDVWCKQCKQMYKPKAYWRRSVWERRQDALEAARLRRLSTIAAEVAKERDRKHKDTLPPVSSWWKAQCKAKARAGQRGEQPPSSRMLEFAFTGSPYKFKDTVNLGGTLWQALTKEKATRDARMLAISRKDASIDNASEMDGFGEGFYIDTTQASNLVTKLDWNVSRSSGDLRFSMDEYGLGLSEVRKTFDTSVTNLDRIDEMHSLSRALVLLSSSVDGLMMDGTNELQESSSRNRSISDEYSQIIRHEGSFGEESLLRTYDKVAGEAKIPCIFECIFLIPISAYITDKGNFSCGLSFNTLWSEGEPEAKAPIQFGKDLFSWGICEEIVYSDSITPIHSNRSSPTTKPHQSSSDISIVYTVYERGKKLYSIPELRQGDRIRLLLDPFSGRLTITVLTAVANPPSGQTKALVSAKTEKQSTSSTNFISRHHTFCVPTGMLENYEVGCTLNSNQTLALLSNPFEEKRAVMSDDLNEMSLESVVPPLAIEASRPGTARQSEGSNALTSARISGKIPRLTIVATQAVATKHEGDSETPLSISSAVLTSRRATKASFSDGVGGDPSTPLTSRTTRGRTASSSSKPGTPTNNTARNSSPNRTPRRLAMGDMPSFKPGEKLGLTKFAARRRNALSTLDVHGFSYPELINKEDSDASWIIGVPGIIPRDAFVDAGVLSLEFNLGDEDEGPTGIFAKDEEREVYIVRLRYSVDQGGDQTRTATTRTSDSAAIKPPPPTERWAIGCCIRGTNRQAQAAWVHKSVGDINHVKLLVTNTNVSSGRIQYLADSRLSVFKWLKGEVFVMEHKRDKRAKHAKKSKEFSVNESFEIPASASRAVHEFVGEWEVIQHVVRAEIDGCIWPGVYYRHFFHGEAENTVEKMSIKRLHPAQVATKSQAAPVTSSWSDVAPLVLPAQEEPSKGSVCNTDRSNATEFESESVREANEAWSRARSFVLVDGKKETEHEYALFAFMGSIREVHVTEVEFLCHA